MEKNISFLKASINIIGCSYYVPKFLFKLLRKYTGNTVYQHQSNPKFDLGNVLVNFDGTILLMKFSISYSILIIQDLLYDDNQHPVLLGLNDNSITLLLFSVSRSILLTIFCYSKRFCLIFSCRSYIDGMFQKNSIRVFRL